VGVKSKQHNAAFKAWPGEGRGACGDGGTLWRRRYLAELSVGILGFIRR
jgi:hypothetical protein